MSILNSLFSVEVDPMSYSDSHDQIHFIMKNCTSFHKIQLVTSIPHVKKCSFVVTPTVTNELHLLVELYQIIDPKSKALLYRVIC